MPEPLTVSGRISIICDQFNVPRSVIEEALDMDTICSVGYAGHIVIDVIDVITIVNKYKENKS